MLNAAFALPFGHYRLPSAILAAVPDDWGWIDGQLDASAEMIMEGSAAHHGGLALDFHHGLRYVTRYDPGRAPETEVMLAARRLGLVELLAYASFPAFLRFDRVGFNAGPGVDLGLTPMPVVRQIADAYIRSGYLGDLFIKRFNERDRSEHEPPSATISLHLAPFSERWTREEDRQPERVKTFDEGVAQLQAAVAVGDDVQDAARKLFPKPRKREHPALVSIWSGSDKADTELESLMTTLRQAQLPELDPDDIRYGYSYQTSPLEDD